MKQSKPLRIKQGSVLGLCCAGLTLVVAVSPADVRAQEAAERVQPSSDWHLDYGEARCRLVRAFGTEDNRTALVLEQHEPSRGLRWVIAGDALSGVRKGREVSVQFGPGFEAFDVTQDGSRLGDYGIAIRGGGFSRESEDSGSDEDESAVVDPPVGLAALDPAEGAGISWLELGRDNRSSHRLELGDMEPAFQAMNTCMADLVQDWGIDLEQARRRATPPKWANIARVARRIQQYYPSAARASGEQADFHLRVMVDAEGKPESCHMTDLTTAEAFDYRACREVMRRAEFDPALDVDGQPMASYYVSRIQYRLN